MKQNEIKKKIGAPLIFYFWGGGGTDLRKFPGKGWSHQGQDNAGYLTC